MGTYAREYTGDHQDSYAATVCNASGYYAGADKQGYLVVGTDSTAANSCRGYAYQPISCCNCSG